jgi:hypothetical protein
MEILHATCPNDPNHKEFVFSVRLAQNWIVSEDGTCLSKSSTLEVLQWPSIGETWICNKCGAVADVTINYT